jgi:hypothetical protein
MLITKNTASAFIVFMLMLGCTQKQKDKTIAKVQAIKPVITETVKPSQAKTINIDSLARYYLANAKNELVAQARRDSTVNEEALFDDERKIGAITYNVFHIGHDFTDNDGARFITDSWIYIDNATGKIYETTPDGGLIRWGN